VIREQLAEHIAPQNLPKGDRPLWKKPAAVAAGPRRGAWRSIAPAAGGPSGKPPARPRMARRRACAEEGIQARLGQAEAQGGDRP